MASRVVMPKLSDTMEEGKILRWLKQEGDKVETGQTLAEVETDKATVEMEAYTNGTILKLVAAPGDTVAIGSLIGIIGAPGEDISAMLEQAPPAAPAPAERVPAPRQAPVSKSVARCRGRQARRLSARRRRRPTTPAAARCAPRLSRSGWLPKPESTCTRCRGPARRVA